MDFNDKMGETEDPEFYDYESYLINNFPNFDICAIKNVVDMVMNNTKGSFDDKLIIMGDMLRNECEESFYDEAVGGAESKVEHLDELQMIFPDANVSYLRKMCKKHNGYYLEDLIDILTTEGYDLKPINYLNTWQRLVEIFPDVDPDFLRKKANELNTETDINDFILSNLDEKSLPSREDYNKRKETEISVNKYTTDFDVNEFLMKFPDPLKYFSNPNRPCALNVDAENFLEDKSYALNFLYNFYPILRKKDIEKVFQLHKYDLILTCDRLDRYPRAFQKPRNRIQKLVTKNLLLVQEIAYIEHKKDIRILFKLCDENYRRAKEEAKKNNLLQTCKCCFDEELIPEECYFCKKFCVFCKNCIKCGAETAIGDGKLEFPCLADCGSEFSFATLQMVLDSVTFAKLAQRKQMEEIKSANIDGLETCPFCDFATIPHPDDKIFHCLNADCSKESCRKCKHISHIPLKCEEIEYDEDIKMRTYIENKMTNALLRECWKCKKTFVKESGCNKMTCQCGAFMCYVCRKPINDYSHFGESVGRCPLWTQDLKKFHEHEVKVGAQSAKLELGLHENPELLKMDPTKDLEKYYK